MFFRSRAIFFLGGGGKRGGGVVGQIYHKTAIISGPNLSLKIIVTHKLYTGTACKPCDTDQLAMLNST